jgi:hypothetical protein
MELKNEIDQIIKEDDSLGTDDPRFEALSEKTVGLLCQKPEATISFLNACNSEELEEISGCLQDVYERIPSDALLLAIAGALPRVGTACSRAGLADWVLAQTKRRISENWKASNYEKNQPVDAFLDSLGEDQSTLEGKVNRLLARFSLVDYQGWSCRCGVFMAAPLDELVPLVKERYQTLAQQGDLLREQKKLKFDLVAERRPSFRTISEAIFWALRKYEQASEASPRLFQEGEELNLQINQLFGKAPTAIIRLKNKVHVTSNFNVSALGSRCDCAFAIFFDHDCLLLEIGADPSTLPSSNK